MSSKDEGLCPMFNEKQVCNLQNWLSANDSRTKGRFAIRAAKWFISLYTYWRELLWVFHFNNWFFTQLFLCLIARTQLHEEVSRAK